MDGVEDATVDVIDAIVVPKSLVEGHTDGDGMDVPVEGVAVGNTSMAADVLVSLGIFFEGLVSDTIGHVLGEGIDVCVEVPVLQVQDNVYQGIGVDLPSGGILGNGMAEEIGVTDRNVKETIDGSMVSLDVHGFLHVDVVFHVDIGSINFHEATRVSHVVGAIGIKT